MAKTADEQLQRLDELISEYETSLGVIMTKPSVDKYLNATIDDIKRMNPEDCSNAAISLNQYAIFIQQNYNREMAKYNWANNRIRNHIASLVSQYSAPNAEERRTLAIQGDDFARRLDQLRGLAQSRIDTLQDIGYKISDLAKKFDGASYSKRRQQ